MSALGWKRRSSGSARLPLLLVAGIRPALNCASRCPGLSSVLGQSSSETVAARAAAAAVSAGLVPSRRGCPESVRAELVLCQRQVVAVDDGVGGMEPHRDMPLYQRRPRPERTFSSCVASMAAIIAAGRNVSSAHAVMGNTLTTVAGSARDVMPSLGKIRYRWLLTVRCER